MILHADVDAFYASVAQRDDPALRGKPVVVGSWVVMAASYEARDHGVRGGMPTERARRLCPGLLIADSSWEAYVEASKAVFAIFERHTDVVEPGSMEEAFLDVSGVPAAPGTVAERIRREVRDEVGLALSVGVARTKVLAKIASRSAKPDGLFVVAPEDELAFLHPLPVERIWGVGPATARRLHAHGLRTVGQAAALDEATLVAILGRAAGRYVHAVSNNRDLRRVRRRRGRRSSGRSGRSAGRGARAPTSTPRSRCSPSVCRTGWPASAAPAAPWCCVCASPTTRGPRARAPSRTRPATRARSRAAARELLEAAAPLVDRRGITLVGITVTNLDGAGGAEQLALFDARPDDSGQTPPARPPSRERSSDRAGGGRRRALLRRLDRGAGIRRPEPAHDAPQQRAVALQERVRVGLEPGQAADVAREQRGGDDRALHEDQRERRVHVRRELPGLLAAAQLVDVGGAVLLALAGTLRRRGRVEHLAQEEALELGLLDAGAHVLHHELLERQPVV
jgi:DNA polymerase-4